MLITSSMTLLEKNNGRTHCANDPSCSEQLKYINIVNYCISINLAGCLFDLLFNPEDGGSTFL
jgi:hypothetical protein